MSEKNRIQKHLLPMLFLFTLLCMFSCLTFLPGTTAQAAATVQSLSENPAYTFTTTNDTSISTKANPNATTVLIFGYTSCGNTRSTLNSLSSCNWVKRPDIRVIFAETNGHTKEEVQIYEQGYQCPDITFCYDEDDTIVMAMAKYAQLFGLTGAKYPTIALIDKNNKIQNLLTGKKTADEILTEIKKFEAIDENPGATPPADPDSGIENFAYGLQTIDNTVISTKANPNETTVLIFGYTTCAFTAATLQDIHKSNWVSRSDIRVIFADVYGASLNETKNFAEKYPGDHMIFCHDESMLNNKLALSYLGLDNQTGGKFPYIILIDKNNKVQSITLGPKTADEIIQAIEKFADKDQNPGGDQNPGNNQNPGDNQNPGNNQNQGNNQNPANPVPSVSNITGLKASSASKNVKLTWKKVSNATGYVIYQYHNSKKTWAKKATLHTNTASYTVKKLTPGTAYRFAVRAFIQPKTGDTIYCKSFTSLYTATAPDAVNFKVTPGKKKATLKWNKVKGATGYTVCYKTKANGSWKKLKSFNGTKYTKSKLKSGTTYYFTVKAYKKYKNKTYTSSFRTKKVKIK